ncbi:hypothetical protein SAMN05444920_110176 [Nonomuraea solani]|uniref:Peptidase inhibitor family I36 n=1 Tax=Nonomuraea solani TaxID=1144553 RepID=A0A1H6EJF2_9ACTN|nr:DUF6289 family protein [Nonomuraea solani]SEG96989.1 hypothetical protein SAMN05444920_110176 [Nonomuraea solani]
MIRRALLATLLALAAVSVAAAPAQARACKHGYTCVTVWYSDSTRTVVVGEKYEDCEGNAEMWGTRSGYVTFDESPCY